MQPAVHSAALATELVVEESGLHLVWEMAADKPVRLLHFSCLPPEGDAVAEPLRKWYGAVELQASGENQDDHHGSKYTGTSPGGRLRYVDHLDSRNVFGRKIEIVQSAEGLTVTSHIQFYDGLPVARMWVEVFNEGPETPGIEYVSSFALAGLARGGGAAWDAKMQLYVPHNTWYGEAQWRTYTLPELGLERVNGFSVKRLSYSGIGTWPCSEFLPMGCLENTGAGSMLFWQIEHNGSWHWELSTFPGDDLLLRASGPTYNESHWWKALAPGDTFCSAPVAVGAVTGGFDEAMAALTRYRRAIRRPNADNTRLPVIFNDYMNCLMADPTTEKETPLIEAAAAAGCEYYVIDAGWYADGLWWDAVGEWLPSEKRFPGGLNELLDLIRAKGMVPGLWLELEVVGVNSPVAAVSPDAWFFQRHGRRAVDHGRYQLDFRNSEVTRHADKVVDRLVNDYGVGYIKMDYNINAGVGTDFDADSAGDGLCEHNRAYTAWLESVFMHYPELVIENCSSGGMRMDYDLLRVQSIQSVTDQTDYEKMAAIAAASPSAVAPEQAAIWSYPLAGADPEHVVFNMVNALLLRIHQSGRIDQLEPESLALMHEGIACYKRIRGDIAEGVPFWPLGLPSFSSPWLSLGLRCAGGAYVAVWRLDAPHGECMLPVRHLAGRAARAECLYPRGMACECAWISQEGALRVRLPQRHTARLIQLTYKAS
jgi:alpha-galactosidase